MSQNASPVWRGIDQRINPPAGMYLREHWDTSTVSHDLHTSHRSQVDLPFDVEYEVPQHGLSYKLKHQNTTARPILLFLHTGIYRSTTVRAAVG